MLSEPWKMNSGRGANRLRICHISSFPTMPGSRLQWQCFFSLRAIHSNVDGYPEDERTASSGQSAARNKVRVPPPEFPIAASRVLSM
jgi:hypothetical protein